MVTNLNSPANIGIKQPNSDWSLALSQLETILPGDLFQKLKTVSGHSPFVKEVFCQYPQVTAMALLWQAGGSDDEIISGLALKFADLYAQVDMDARTDPDKRDGTFDQTALDQATVNKLLRLFRRIQSAAIAMLELLGELPIESSCARISALADCLIINAYRWCRASLREQFGQASDCEGNPQNLLILAMGKLGGYELNFSSDIDLIFFYPGAGETRGGERAIDNARYFRRLSGLLIGLLNEVNADGFVYRVDMRLRPYGESGALAMSFAQAEDYYQEQGRDWERFALLRARLLTGSEGEARQLNAIIQPFAYRRYIDYGVIDSIRSMKQMIQREVRRKKLSNNIKLGAGGIREIEFIIQSMQLIQGGRDKKLRERNTLKVLPLLVRANLLPQAVADTLGSAYRFLRRVEHCIQEYAEKQTQLLPENAAERAALCFAMGQNSWQQLFEQIEAHQLAVHNCFNELLGDKRQRSLTQDEFYQSLAEGHIEADKLLQHSERSNTEQALTLAQSEDFINELERFNQSPMLAKLSTRGVSRLKIFFPALLATCLATEQPEITLQRLLTVLHAILKRTVYLDLLSENPPIMQHLVDLVGASPWMMTRLSDYPILLDELLYPNSLYRPLESADLKSELQQSLLRSDPQDEEELMDTLRTFKQTNELRLAAALLTQRLSISQVSRYLTQLAEVILQASLLSCWRLLVARYGSPQSQESRGASPVEAETNEGSDGELAGTGFAIIGYGKLGGAELGFGSDLDLVFLFDRPVDGYTDGDRAIGNSRFYTRLAQKLIHFLSTRTNLGLLYEVDMRLRPSGSSGLLVSHLQAYRDYQMESAWTWEHQALVRARFIAGDENLAKGFFQVKQQVLQSEREPKKLRDDVIAMRKKMQTQLWKNNAQQLDLKQMPGGLVDIEFIAQFLALSYRGKALIPSSTVAIYQLMSQEKVIKDESARLVVETYRLLRNRINQSLLTGNSLHELDEKLLTNIESVKKAWQDILG